MKGFDNLLVLIAPILKKHKDWSLMFVGESLNNGGDFLLNLATNLKIQNQVIFAGLRDDVQQIMAKSEIFVLSSRTEGLPMVLIEAMSQNMCCIAYDCISGPSDIINHDVNGILIENQNTTDMASAINKVIENPELRKKLANKANEVLIKFDENLICDKWEYLIKNI
nr:glycosyltransferase [Jejuia pallidilutea]